MSTEWKCNIFLFFLIEIEAVVVSFISILIGGAGLTVTLIASNDFLSYNYGLHVDAPAVLFEIGPQGENGL